jgi:hypothetical protein
VLPQPVYAYLSAARNNIDTKDVLKLLIVGDSAVRLLGHPWSALRVVKNCRKDCPTAKVLAKPKQ